MNERPLLLFAGVATEDSIAVVDRYPGSDERVVADDVVFAGGGPAATAAVAAARLGMRTAIVAAVGDDEAGALVRSRLDAEGVDTSGIHTVDGGQTSRSVVIISGAKQERAIVNRPGPALQWSATGYELLRDAAWVHVDQHGWAPTRAALSELGTGAKLSIDAGNPIPGLTLDNTALYAPTLPALRARYPHVDPGDIVSLLARARDDGAELVAVTNGGEGSYGIGPDGVLAHVTPPAGEIRSTLGAGDVFHGALLAGLVHAETGAIAPTFAAALAYATTVATISCRALDGRSGIPDHAETLLHLDPIYTN